MSNVNDEPYDDDVEMADQQVYGPNDPNSDLESNLDVGLDPPIMVPVAQSDSSSDERHSDIDVHSRALKTCIS